MTRGLEAISVDERIFLRAVGHVVSGRRADLGLTQQQVADRVGTSREEVARVEGRPSGQVLFQLTTLWRVIAALDWTGHDFSAAVEAELRRRLVAGPAPSRPV